MPNCAIAVANCIASAAWGGSTSAVGLKITQTGNKEQAMLKSARFTKNM
jgi:hypothetical protein